MIPSAADALREGFSIMSRCALLLGFPDGAGVIVHFASRIPNGRFGEVKPVWIGEADSDRG